MIETTLSPEIVLSAETMDLLVKEGSIQFAAQLEPPTPIQDDTYQDNYNKIIFGQGTEVTKLNQSSDEQNIQDIQS